MATPTPNWKQAPAEATHYHVRCGVFCNKDGYWDANQKFTRCPHSAYHLSHFLLRPVKEEIDIARLHVDAKYWDEVAPEDATHMIDEMRFVKWVGIEEWEIYFLEDGAEWGRPATNWSLDIYLDRCGDWDVVARPAYPDESDEWNGEGYPPVGTVCQLEKGDKWIDVVITARGECVTVYKKDIGMGRYSYEVMTEAYEDEWRKALTADEIAKEDLEYLITNGLGAGLSASSIAHLIVEAGYAKCN